MKVTKDMIITDVMNVDPAISSLLMASGMHCISCFAAGGETIEQAAMVHGLDADDIVDMINEYLNLKENGEDVEF
jgi:hybrid cluster-associated redox disulfide protein